MEEISEELKERKITIPMTSGAPSTPEIKVTTTFELPEEKKKEPIFVIEKLECMECYKDNVILYSCYIDPNFPTIMCANCWKVLIKTITETIKER